ncbi:MAG: C10 family peptidase [Bacteroidaceae bacterium]|nr:C10 family peptidase [Bacteroidaceae bacterium]
MKLNWKSFALLCIVNLAFCTGSIAQVDPLVKTEWSQRSPYNDMCPVDSKYNETTLAGCVAIAMAQVMNYWQWPIHGIGKNSYRWTDAKDKGKTLSANFGDTYYRWEDMESDPVAVSTFVYHCGVAVYMDYSTGFSGSSEYYAKSALESNFGYSEDIQMRPRNLYTDEQWAALLKENLDNGWPIIYSSGVHTYVVDGYNKDGLFHNNQGYGWGGYWWTIDQMGDKGSSTAIINIHPDYSSKAKVEEPTFVVFTTDGKSAAYPTAQIDEMLWTTTDLKVTKKDETTKTTKLNKLSYVKQLFPTVIDN